RAEASSLQSISPVSRRASVLPIHPIHRMAVEIAADGGANGRKEGIFTKSGEQPKALELVFYRILELGKAQLDSGRVPSFVQFGKSISGSDIYTGDRFRGNHQPVHRSGRFRRCLQNTLFEKLGVGEEQGRVPTKEDQAGYLAGVGIARDVMVAPDT